MQGKEKDEKMTKFKLKICDDIENDVSSSSHNQLNENVSWYTKEMWHYKKVGFPWHFHANGDGHFEINVDLLMPSFKSWVNRKKGQIELPYVKKGSAAFFDKAPEQGLCLSNYLGQALAHFGGELDWRTHHFRDHNPSFYVQKKQDPAPAYPWAIKPMRELEAAYKSPEGKTLESLIDSIQQQLGYCIGLAEVGLHLSNKSSGGKIQLDKWGNFAFKFFLYHGNEANMTSTYIGDRRKYAYTPRALVLNFHVKPWLRYNKYVQNSDKIFLCGEINSQENIYKGIVKILLRPVYEALHAISKHAPLMNVLKSPDFYKWLRFSSTDYLNLPDYKVCVGRDICPIGLTGTVGQFFQTLTFRQYAAMRLLSPHQLFQKELMLFVPAVTQTLGVKHGEIFLLYRFDNYMNTFLKIREWRKLCWPGSNLAWANWLDLVGMQVNIENTQHFLALWENIRISLWKSGPILTTDGYYNGVVLQLLKIWYWIRYYRSVSAALFTTLRTEAGQKNITPNCLKNIFSDLASKTLSKFQGLLAVNDAVLDVEKRSFKLLCQACIRVTSPFPDWIKQWQGDLITFANGKLESQWQEYKSLDLKKDFESVVAKSGGGQAVENNLKFLSSTKEVVFIK